MFKNNQLFAAPLAGITDKPFRKIIREFSSGVSLVTEMISCHSLVEQHKNCPRNFDRYDDEGNIGAQIFGADPNLMAEAAKILQDSGAKWIDINMGCPVPKVANRAGAGAFLMRDHKLAKSIMESVVGAVQIPVSIKTRLGWDSEHIDWAELVSIAADCGISFCTLHGRTKASGYSGIAEHPDVNKCLMPIISNGDIKQNEDLLGLEDLGYCGAMIGRGMLGKPWIFEVLQNKKFCVPSVKDTVLRHLSYVLDYYGVKVGVPMFRKHVAWYSCGMSNATNFRMEINRITSEDELRKKISEFWN